MQRRAVALMAEHGKRPEGRSPYLEDDVADAETNLDLEALVGSGDVRATLLFVRLLERMRRAIALEFGLPLNTVRAHSGFVSRISARALPASYGIVHADESSCDEFHYSAILYLNSQGVDFGGGDFVFSDPPRAAQRGDEPSTHASQPAGVTVEEHAGGRTLSRLAPRRGRALIFSGGFENIHYVDAVRSGERMAIGTFWTTVPADADDSGQDLAVMAAASLQSYEPLL